MTKVRRIALRDYVTYMNKEWVVVGRSKKHVQLIRRQVGEGTKIKVRKSKVKLADQSWRKHLKYGDPIQYFLSGYWVPARVIVKRQDSLDIQPSFSNYTIVVKPDSSRIAKMDHDYPLWEATEVCEVIYNGRLRLQRAPGLLYPWEYADTAVEIPSAERTYVRTVKYDRFDTLSYPCSMFNTLDTEQIAFDLFQNRPPNMPDQLHMLISQYITHRGAKYEICLSGSVDLFASYALEYGDEDRLRELLSVGENHKLYKKVEWLIAQRYYEPVFDLNIAYEDGKVVVDIFKTSFNNTSISGIRALFQQLSTPFTYKPETYEVNSTPEMSYILSKMLGMEESCVQNIHFRRMGEHIVSKYEGFLSKIRLSYGGVICVYGLRVVQLVSELMSLSPWKTLVITSPNSMSMWKDHSQYFARRKDDDLLVVTTKNTYIRNFARLNAYDRIICTCKITPYTEFDRCLRSAKAKIRWTIARDVQQLENAWELHGFPYRDEKGEIVLSKKDQEDMGVVFPTIKTSLITCDGSPITHLYENTKNMSYAKREQLITQYMLHPSLVPEHLTGEKLSMYEGTVDAIAKTLNVKEEQIQEHADDKCAVCLDTMDQPTVTSCGHVFCAECTQQLQMRHVNCPMCRSKVQGFMKISDKNTPGKIVMHKGFCYRVSYDQKWGSKMDILRKHPNATIISTYANTVSKLKKELPNKDVFTLISAMRGRIPVSNKVILVEYAACSVPKTMFDYAYGRDLDVTILNYTTSL